MLVVLGVCAPESQLDGYQHLQMKGEDVILKAASVEQPSKTSPLGSCRWFEEPSDSALSKMFPKRARLTALDAVIALLRALRDQMLTVMMAEVEGALLVQAVLSATVRM